jgi:O-methyltransferase
MKEPPSPLTDDPSRRVQPRRDLSVMQPLGRVEHDPRALDLLPRTLLSPRDPDQPGTLLLTQFDPVTGRARHHQQGSTRPARLLHRFRRELTDASTRLKRVPNLSTGARAFARSAFQQRKLSALARSVRKQRLTYLTPSKLARIEDCLTDVIRHGVPGDFLETGVALGGSAIVIAGRLDRDRRFHGYDVFEMIPPPGESDPPEVHDRYAVIASGASEGIDGETYYGYRDRLYDNVVAAFAEQSVPVDGDRVQLHRGLFEDTLHLDRPVAFAHIDCDWHDPVALCLERIHPWLQPGGWLVIDDYYAYRGAKSAVDAFRADNPDLVAVDSGDTEHLLLRRS